jgi:hypothetical protein
MEAGNRVKHRGTAFDIPRWMGWPFARGPVLPRIKAPLWGFLLPLFGEARCALKLNDVQVGAHYHAKVSGRLQVVRVTNQPFNRGRGA